MIEILNSYPPTLVAVYAFLFYILFLYLSLRTFGVYGVYSYICIALVGANIQVLKGAQFLFPSHPIVMGTVLFGTIALAFDILTEYYGKAIALQGVRLSFMALCFFAITMLLTTIVQPLNPQMLKPDELFLVTNHEHIKALFQPLPSILLASLIAYLFSQFADVMIFGRLKILTEGRRLWFRTFLATACAAFIDTCLFSFLAWKLFSHHPVSWETLLTIYILGTYPLRLLISILLTPLIYGARYFLPRTHEYVS